MKKLFVIIALLSSYAMGNNYTDGCKLYRQGKIALRHHKTKDAQSLFLEAKIIFDKIAKEKHSSQAILKLANMYCNGYGVVVNKSKAKQLLNEAIKFGASTQFVSPCLKNLK
jgi:TPR repeat protein